jgi:2-polyprenyl-3-methyl-5-hydroxy-6-metoxy-1,4-benzoquinol methylase
LFGLAYRTVRGMMLGKKAALLKKYTAQKGRLLDIGCGQGHFLQKMKTQGFEVFGIEQDEQIAKLAKEKFGIEVHTADWLTKQKDGSFAAITMWHSLEHLQHLNETLQEAKRLLAEDGALVVALPNIDSFDRKYYGLHWAGYDVPRHLWHFSPKTFKILAKKHGFELKKRKAMLFDVFYISILSERNLQSKFATFKGLYFGLRAYLKTLTKAKKASSMIYVLKKKQSA